MTPEEITEAARRIKGFAGLPATAQISLLYSEIEAARSLGIPIPKICEALNEAGASIGVRYFRQALFSVRGRMAELESQGGKPAAQSAVKPAPPKPATNSGITAPAAESARIPKAKAREEKANAYMGSDNPLLNQLGKKD